MMKFLGKCACFDTFFWCLISRQPFYLFQAVVSSFGGGKKRGRKPSNVDTAKRVEQSRLSARECRARKKLRYQYVEELVLTRERAVFSLRRELSMVCMMIQI